MPSRITVTITYEPGGSDQRAVWEYIAAVALLQYPEITGVEITTEEED